MTEGPINLVTLDQELASLDGPIAPGTFLGAPIFEGAQTRLLRGADGKVSLLIAGTTGSHAALKLRNVEARPRMRCRVKSPDGSSLEVEGSLVTCTATDPQLRNLFLDLLADALKAYGPTPSAVDVAGFLHRIATLFVKLEKAGTKRLRGLWAELAVMLALDDCELAARRWHADPKERLDFLSGSFAIEVKSCQDLERVHHFSLEQLRPAPELDCWIASVVVRPDPKGHSVLDLMKLLQNRIADEATRDTMRAMVLASGGSALEEDDLHRFDWPGAKASVRFFDARAVPSISEDIAPEIFAVSLQVRCRDVLSSGDVGDALERLAARA